jgi:UDP-glucuronate 4-epimerase
MAVLVTGAAGFIGFHVARALLARGDTVVGIDNLNPYYDVALKRARLEQLASARNFRFVPVDIADRAAFARALAPETGIDRIVHLAAQAGVRHSLENPFAYVEANLVGHLVILEFARQWAGRLRHLVYASSSSVYGGNTKQPFAVEDRVDAPVSLYAATKKADELMSHAYSHLYGLAQTGLRFFTVYGPWGRPDMAMYRFAEAIFADRPITLYNHGDMKRDFTFIDDAIAGTVAALDRPPAADARGVRHAVYNLGNNRPEPLARVIDLFERATNRKAAIERAPMQPGDVKETYADIEPARRAFGYAPARTIDDGIPEFVAWYRRYHGV